MATTQRRASGSTFRALLIVFYSTGTDFSFARLLRAITDGSLVERDIDHPINGWMLNNSWRLGANVRISVQFLHDDAACLSRILYIEIGHRQAQFATVITEKLHIRRYLFPCQRQSATIGMSTPCSRIKW